MAEKYLAAGFAIVVDALVVAAAGVVVAFVYWLATGAGGEYLADLSNFLFFAGGVTLTFGAIAEFFHVGKTTKTYKMLMAPKHLLGAQYAGDANGNEVGEEQQAGWALIALGATLIVFSLIVSLAI